MRKIFCFLSILALINPAFAAPVAGMPSHADPATLATDNGGTILPGYDLVSGATTDVNAASAGYVKGAYNATIKAVNTVASVKQDKITVSQTTGVNVTSVSLNADDGKTINVARTNETTIPVGSNNAATRARIWVE